MKIIELLKEIKKGNIHDGAIFHGGDCFYPMIVSNQRLYFLNTIKNEFMIVDSYDIAHLIEEDYEMYQFKKVIEK